MIITIKILKHRELCMPEKVEVDMNKFPPLATVGDLKQKVAQEIARCVDDFTLIWGCEWESHRFLSEYEGELRETSRVYVEPVEGLRPNFVFPWMSLQDEFDLVKPDPESSSKDSTPSSTPSSCTEVSVDEGTLLPY